MILLALLCGSFLNLLIPLAKADYSSYLGIKVGTTYTFSYTVSPPVLGVTRNTNIPITITSISNYSASASNVTYQTTYTIMQNESGISVPVNQETGISVIINESMDLLEYVNDSSSWLGIFFIFSSTNGEEIAIPTSEHSHIGNGTISWDANGILLLATLSTSIDNKNCTISIAPASQGSTPGFSIPLIGCILVGTVVLIGTQLVKKEKKKITSS